MCGIGAVVFREKEKAIDFIKQIMINQKNRGTSSCGVAWVEDGEIKIQKEVGGPDNFNYPRVRTRIVLGHNRMPSVGAVTVANANPFKSCDGSLALVHNGTFAEHELLRRMLNGHKYEGDVDSEVIMHFIEEFKDMKGIIKLMRMFYGQRLLVMMRDGTIYGFGDLEIIKDKEGVYVANELGAFSTLFEGKRKYVYSVGSDTIFKIETNGKLKIYGSVEKNRRKIGKEVVRRVWGIFIKDESEEEVEDEEEVEGVWIGDKDLSEYDKE